jgi:hypothetical protein
MTMLLLVFRESLDHDLRELQKELELKVLTEAPKVFGVGDAGTAFSSSAWLGSNSRILPATHDA